MRNRPNINQDHFNQDNPAQGDKHSTPILLLIIGPSGSGKSTIIRKLMERSVDSIDLDEFGFRDDKGRWIIPYRSLFSVLRKQSKYKLIVTSGISHNLFKSMDHQNDGHYPCGIGIVEADVVITIMVKPREIAVRGVNRDRTMRCNGPNFNKEINMAICVENGLPKDHTYYFRHALNFYRQCSSKKITMLPEHTILNLICNWKDKVEGKTQ